MIRPIGGLATSVIPSSDFTSASATIGLSRASSRPHISAARLTRFLISIVLLGIAVALVSLRFDTSSVFEAVRRLSILTLGCILLALLSNVLVAALRLKIIASDIGSPLDFRQALAAVSGGNLAGAAFFQIAGQLMARGAIMAQSGIPFASVVVMTTYERIIAAVLSGFLALAGAYIIFGHIVIDRYAGGDQLIKIIAGLLAATTVGAVVGHGKLTARAITPFMKWRGAAQILRIAGLSLLVQLPMMAAYVMAAHALSPQTSIVSITAASAIVMFAASVPISLAGWGVREMSAVVALGTIGVGAANALVAAIIIGAGSMLAMSPQLSLARVQCLP
jgi:uncharacterized membrane protein YbhN (UPF0104 family)